MKLTIGSKTCSLPLFYSEFLHLNLRSMTIIFPKYTSDMSQKCPIRLLTLNLLPFIIPTITLSATSVSTRIGLFVMGNTQHLESMFASFRRVACFFTIYSFRCAWAVDLQAQALSRINIQPLIENCRSIFFDNAILVEEWRKHEAKPRNRSEEGC